MKLVAFKKIDENTYHRKTNEVEIAVTIDENEIGIIGKGDCRHHLLEDTIILLKKILGGHEKL